MSHPRLASSYGTGRSLDPLFSLGNEHRGLTIGLALAGAVFVHAAGAAQAYAVGNRPTRWARDVRQSMTAMVRTEYEVDFYKPPPPPPEPPAPAKEEEPPAPTPAPKIAAAPKSPTANEPPPPAPAQAGKILAQEPDPEAPVDLTGEGFVTGTAASYAGGVTTKDGTSTGPVRNQNAVSGGVPGGTGKGPPVPTAPAVDRSRAAGLAGSSNWACPFPPEADADQIDYQRVPIVVTVRPDGTPQSVRVIEDPGHGFGRAARDCALRQRFTPAFDREGRAITGTTPAIYVRFARD